MVRRLGLGILAFGANLEQRKSFELAASNREIGLPRLRYWDAVELALSASRPAADGCREARRFRREARQLLRDQGPSRSGLPIRHDERRLRRGTFTSVDVLIEAIEVWAEHWNDNPQPFVWKKTADDIITKISRGRTALTEGQIRDAPLAHTTHNHTSITHRDIPATQRRTRP